MLERLFDTVKRASLSLQVQLLHTREGMKLRYRVTLEVLADVDPSEWDFERLELPDSAQIVDAHVEALGEIPEGSATK